VEAVPGGLQGWRDANSEFLPDANEFDKPGRRLHSQRAGQNTRYCPAVQQAVVTAKEPGEFRAVSGMEEHSFCAVRTPDGLQTSIWRVNNQEKVVQAQIAEFRACCQDLGIGCHGGGQTGGAPTAIGQQIPGRRSPSTARPTPMPPRPWDHLVRVMDRPVCRRIEAASRAQIKQAEDNVRDCRRPSITITTVCRDEQQKAEASIEKLLKINSEQVTAESQQAAHLELLQDLFGDSDMIWAGRWYCSSPGSSRGQSPSQFQRQVAATLSTGSEQVVSAAGQVGASSQVAWSAQVRQAASIEGDQARKPWYKMVFGNCEDQAEFAENSQQANDLARQTRAAADQRKFGRHAVMSAAMPRIKNLVGRHCCEDFNQDD